MHGQLLISMQLCSVVIPQKAIMLAMLDERTYHSHLVFEYNILQMINDIIIINIIIIIIIRILISQYTLMYQKRINLF